jgi:hypothetical protein
MIFVYIELIITGLIIISALFYVHTGKKTDYLHMTTVIIPGYNGKRDIYYTVKSH